MIVLWIESPAEVPKAVAAEYGMAQGTTEFVGYRSGSS